MTKIDYEMTNFVYEALKKVRARQFGKKDAVDSINRIVPILKSSIKSIDTDTAILLVWFGSFCVRILNGEVVESISVDDFFKIAQRVGYEDFYSALDEIFKTHALIQQHREI